MSLIRVLPRNVRVPGRLSKKLSFLFQKQGAGRSKVLLDTAPAHRLADIFVASFESSLEERLAMLDAVSVKERLVKATELVTRHLQVGTQKPRAGFLCARASALLFSSLCKFCILMKRPYK
jgi:hypothetical protein